MNYRKHFHKHRRLRRHFGYRRHGYYRPLINFRRRRGLGCGGCLLPVFFVMGMMLFLPFIFGLLTFG